MEIPQEPSTQFISKEIRQQEALMKMSIQGWIAGGFTVAVIAMAFMGRTVEEPLYSLTVMAISFYFGQNKQTKTTAQ